MDKYDNPFEQQSFINDKSVDKSVDKPKKTKKNQQTQEMGLKITQRIKRKTITINLDQSLVECNFMEIPFVMMDRKSNIGTFEVLWTDSHGNKRGLEVVGSSKYGVPSSSDFTVLMGLLKIHSENNSIINYSHEDDSYNMPIRINFTFSELARVLGRTIGGQSFSLLQDSIRILGSTTIVSKFSAGLYDYANKEYIKTSGEKGNKILDYHIYDHSKNKKIIKEDNYVEIDPFFYNSMCKGYFKIINFTLYQSLSRNIAKRLYLMLEKWNRSKEIYSHIKYQTLYERIPINPEKTISAKNRLIKDAVEELKNKGYLEDYKTDDKGVFFIFDASKYKDLINQNQEFYGLNLYNSKDEITKELIDYGLSLTDVNKYIHSVDMKYIRALLRYFKNQLNQDKIEKNPIGFLIAGLEGRYKIDEKYYN